jgi:hypothetical protein
MLLAASVLVPATPVRAAVGTLKVCPAGCTYSSIQAAVDAASSGDTIDIGKGVYHETVRIERAGSSGFDVYTDGNAYLSGGAEFTRQSTADGNFEVLSGDAPGTTLVSNAVGVNDSYNYWGQSFTVPASESSPVIRGFRFLRGDGTTASGAGTGYLFEAEYTGTPAGLATAAPLASATWNGTAYEFGSEPPALTPGAKYWFYADSPVTVGTGAPVTVTRFALALRGAGERTTILDGGGVDIALRIGEGVDVTATAMTVRNGRSPVYAGGTAYQEGSVLVNLTPTPAFLPNDDADTNFAVLGAGAAPLVSASARGGEAYAVWGQSFTVPGHVPFQLVTGFRFFLADGTPAGAGTGYLFENNAPHLVGADALASQPYVAKGAWNGSVYDLAASPVYLRSGRPYVFLSGGRRHDGGGQLRRRDQRARNPRGSRAAGPRQRRGDARGRNLRPGRHRGGRRA